MNYLQSRFFKQYLLAIMLYIFSFNYVHAQSDTAKVNLSENDKTKIFLEEKYRNEIRKQIESTNSGNWINKAKEFLNSPFAIWFFPTVAIGLITFLYQKRQGKREKEKATSEKLTRLFIEMENMIIKFESGFHIKEKRQKWNSANYGGHLEHSLGGGFYYSPVFPEFSKRSFVSLALDASNLSSSIEQKKVLKTLASQAQNLEEVEKEIKGDQPIENISSFVDKGLTVLKTKFDEAKT